jgi:mRNA interferase RelE/StbE
VAGYRVLIKPSAAKELEAVGQKKDRERLVGSIRALGSEPRPQGCEKLSGQHGLFRVCVGPYRIVYTIDDGSAKIHVVKVGHRKDVYRRSG